MAKTKRTDEIELNLNVWEDEYSMSIRMNVGRAIKKRRLEIGLEAQVLADALGLSKQQLQKFEKGINSIRIQKMWKFCELLRKPLSYFVENAYKADEGFNTSDSRIRRLMGMFDALDEKGQLFVLEFCQNSYDNRKG